MRKRLLTVFLIILALTLLFAGCNKTCMHENQQTETMYDATCDTTGYTGNVVCLDCGVIVQEGETIPALGHDPVVVDTIVATCTEGGCTGETTCQRCGTILEESKETPPKGHTEVVEGETKATCTKAGNTGKVICKDCGIVLKENETIEALGHTVETEGYKVPTCTADGYSGDKHCSVCNTVLEKGKVLPQSHDIVVTGQKNATCSAEGYSGDKYCKVCGAEISKGKVLAKIAHNSATKNAKSATCTTDGYSGDTYCTYCNITLTTGKTIPATNHSNQEVRNKKSATKSEAGYTGDKYCKDCNTLLEKGSVIEKLPSIPSYDCINSLEQSLLAEINAFRAENGLHPLTFDSTVHKGSHIRVNEFIYREIHGVDVAPHNRLDGSYFGAVFEEIGLGKSPYGHYAEIIAAASRPERLFPAWKESTKGHREAMLEADFTHIGLCVVYNNSTYYAVAILHNNAPPVVMN